MATKVLFIVNPISGTVRSKGIDRIIPEMIPDGLSYEIKLTEYAGHGKILAKEAVEAGVETIVAVGGDGTINEVACQLYGTNSKLGIVPMGSGNGLALHLGVPLNTNKAIKRIFNGESKRIDVGLINGTTPFFCTSGVGFDGLVSYLFGESEKRGLLNYSKIVLQELPKFKSIKVEIKTDQGEEVTEEAFFVTLANAGQFGNNMYIAPQAEISDGILELCIVKKFPVHLLPKFLYLVRAKKLTENNYLKYYRCKEVNITLPNPSYAHLDGEPLGRVEGLNYKILPQVLDVVV